MTDDRPALTCPECGSKAYEYDGKRLRCVACGRGVTEEAMERLAADRKPEP